jgi:hypothetical protein
MKGRRMSRRLPAVLVAVVVAATVAVPGAQATPQVGRSFVFYAKPTRAQFINHADDRARGNITNPFDTAVPPTPANANSAKKGARAGDGALFTLRLYSDAKLTRPVGTAAYSCTFNFGQQAICEGQFQLGGATMIAMGPADLQSGDFVLPVTGGTGRYAGAHGQLTSRSASSKKNTQIIRFRLV